MKLPLATLSRHHSILSHVVIAAGMAVDGFSWQQHMHGLTRFLLLRAICLAYLFAYLSLYVQVEGLIGVYGLVSITDTFKTIKKYLRSSKQVKTSKTTDFLMRCTAKVFELDLDSDRGIAKHALLCILGSLFGVIYPHFSVMIFLYFNYSCFKRVCGPFMNLQWDALLLEVGFVSIFYALASHSLVVTLCNALIKILLYRLMFGSGVVKLFSRDKSWHEDLTAMEYHFLTQPLPNRLSVWAHNSSKNVLRLITIGTLVFEFIVPPVGMFLWVSPLVALLYLMLQISIMMTGNFGFFNALSAAMGLALLDDSWLFWVSKYFVPKSLFLWLGSQYALIKPLQQVNLFSLEVLSLGVDVIVLIFILVYSIISLVAIELLYDRFNLPTVIMGTINEEGFSSGNDGIFAWIRGIWQSLCGIAYRLHKRAASLYLGCHYGLFATMTKRRDELVVEVSKDGKSEWQVVEFKFKPGSCFAKPKPVWPLFHMPRLDWMMWFVALRPAAKSWPEWLWNLLIAILEGNRDILRLLDTRQNAFLFNTMFAIPDDSNSDISKRDFNATPHGYRYVRVRLFNYTFASTASTTTRIPNSNNNGNDSPRTDGVTSPASPSSHNKHQSSPSSAASSPSSPSSSHSSSTTGGGPGVSAGTTASQHHTEDSAPPQFYRPPNADSPFWKAEYVATLLSPSNLEKLYEITDRNLMDRHRLERRVQAPTPDTATNIITRTLRNLQQKKKKENGNDMDGLDRR